MLRLRPALPRLGDGVRLPDLPNLLPRRGRDRDRHRRRRHHRRCRSRPAHLLLPSSAASLVPASASAGDGGGGVERLRRGAHRNHQPVARRSGARVLPARACVFSRASGESSRARVGLVGWLELEPELLKKLEMGRCGRTRTCGCVACVMWGGVDVSGRFVFFSFRSLASRVDTGAPSRRCPGGPAGRCLGNGRCVVGFPCRL